MPPGTGATLDSIRILWDLGVIGALTDAELLDRFLADSGDASETAFAILVERHGPAVRRVCLDVLGDPHDAQDAAQAVFLVLARRARSIRRPGALGSWLHGVALRVARRALAESARRREVERQAVRESAIHPAPPPCPELHEELDRLPEKYRAPIVLCDLEGQTQEQAARSLGWPLGTVQTRLHRGRQTLHGRLVRRGIVPAGLAAAGLSIPRAVAAPIAASWIRATARAAARFAARESLADLIPASVATLAQGVLTTLFRSTLKLAAVGLFAASFGVIGVGMAVLAHGPVDGSRPPELTLAQAPAIVPPQPKEKPASKPRFDEISGIVVDEAGRPVPGAAVKLFSLNAPSVRSESREDGSFALPLPDRAEGTAYRVLIITTHDDDRRQASQEILLRRGQPTPAARFVLKAALELTVRAEDGLQRPVSGAAIEVLSGFSSIGRRSTGDDGIVSLRLPADLEDFSIIGLKSHVGFDYFNFSNRRTWPFPIDAATTIPRPIRLALDGVRPLRMKVVEANGKPSPGVELAISTVTSERRVDGVLLSASEIARATSADDGIATFDWLPTRWLPADRVPSADMPMEIHFVRVRLKTKGLLQDREHFIDSPTANHISEFRVLRPTRISGRVLDPDGKPAAGITIIASGRGSDPPDGMAAKAFGRTITDSDGRYALELRPETFTMIGVDDRRWAATSRKGIFIEPGRPRDDVDFRLVRGTVLRGRVLTREGKPVEKASLILSEVGDNFPARVETSSPANRTASLIRRGETEADGRYEFRVGPGKYWLDVQGPKYRADAIDVGDEESIERDVRILVEPRPPQPMPMISGTVMGPDGRPVAGAIVKATSAFVNNGVNSVLPLFETVSDAVGRFRGTRDQRPLLVFAYTPDRTLAALEWAELAQDKVVLQLTPSVRAQGRVVDGNGTPRAGIIVSVDWLMKQGGHEFGNYATISLETDADGRYSLAGLPVGASLLFGVDRNDEDTFQPFEATRSGTIEVKDIILDAPARKLD